MSRERPPMATGWYDDAAAAAVFGPIRIVVAVTANRAVSEELVEWLDSAIPALAPWRVWRVQATELLDVVTAEAGDSRPGVWVVSDAWRGDNHALRARWASWNRARERIHTAVAEGRRGIVFACTVPRMEEVARAAPDLLAVADVFTAQDEPLDALQSGGDVVEAYRRVLTELETRYGLRSDELAQRLMDRTPRAEVIPHDLARWTRALEALRNAETDAG